MLDYRLFIGEFKKIKVTKNGELLFYSIGPSIEKAIRRIKNIDSTVKKSKSYWFKWFKGDRNLMLNTKRQLGISIYPSHQKYQDLVNYIDLAHKYGFTRIFSSLLTINNGNKEEVIMNYKKIFKYARQKGFDVCLDVNPNIFNILGASPNDLYIYKEIGATTIRIDEPFNGKAESDMTYNPYDLNIEVNISNGGEYINNIMSYKPKKENIVGCHNFYPQKNSGLDYDYFLKSTAKAKEGNIRTCVFISSNNDFQGARTKKTDGLPTVEMHRNMTIDLQARHLWATNLIDDIIIGNAYASEKELRSLSLIDKYKVSLKVQVLNSASPIERKILFLDNHFRRGDVNSFSIRSTMSRITYQDEKYPPHNNDKDGVKGDIYIMNENFQHYNGELQIILKKVAKDNRKNLIAKVVEEDLFLLDFIKSWDHFVFIEK